MKKNFKTFLKGTYVDFIIIDENFVKNTDWFDWINQSINTEFLTVGKFWIFFRWPPGRREVINNSLIIFRRPPRPAGNH